MQNVPRKKCASCGKMIRPSNIKAHVKACTRPMNTCANCGVETKSKKYCSRACSNIAQPRRQRQQRQQPQRRVSYAINTCTTCGQKTSNPKYCSNACSGIGRRNTQLTEWLAGNVSGTSLFGNTQSFIKRWLRETYGDKCSRCGWAEVHPTTGNVPVELDHIDGDHMNSRPENVRLLCPNCHALTPTFRALNVGNGRPKRRKITGS